MKRLAASTLALGLILAGVMIAPQAAFAATDVHGTVTRMDGTTPIPTVDVEFFQGDQYVGFGTTDSNGWFSTSTIPAGDYTVLFVRLGYVPEYYSDTYVKSSAAVVTVADGGSTTLNASLEVESTITGTIRDYNGDPVENVWVSVYTENSGWQLTKQGYTDGSGAYTVGQLSGGNVKVFAAYMYGGELQTAWYTNGYSEATATVLALPGAGGTAVVDIVLPLGATIRGSVVDSIGSPIGVDMIATGAGLDDSQNSGSDLDDGLYEMRGLHPQVYSVTTDDYWGLFAPATPQNVTAVVGTPATADFILTPALVDEAEFVDAVTPLSGPTTVEAGKTYTWVVQPDGNENVYAILYSSPVYLGAAVRSTDGSATLTLTIPMVTTPGTHKLTLSSMNDQGEGTELVRQYFDLTVTAPALAATGVDVAPIGLLALLLGGVGLLGVLSTRRTARRN